MATISGIADISSYVAQLIALERQSGPSKVYTEDKEALTKRSATLTDLRTNLTALNTQLQSLMKPGTLSPFGAKSVTSSGSGVATATASAGAMTGTHSLFVSRLAKRSTVVSTQWSLTGADLASAAGAGERTFRISVNGVNTDVTVSVDAADDNQAVLTKMLEAINASDAKVTASIVKDSDTTGRLVIASNETGSANAITLADQTGALLAATGTNSGSQASGTTGGYLYASGDLDAVFVLDGLTITRGENSVDDVLTGVTLNLASTQASGATPVTLTVAADADAIKSKIQAFLDAYNTVIKFLKERTGVSTSTNTESAETGEITVTRGTLASNPTYLGLMMNLRSDAGGQITPATEGGPTMLAEIGITGGTDGTLSITDSTKFIEALTGNIDGVTALLGGEGGIASRLSARLTGFITTGGLVDSNLTSITARLESVNRAIQQQEAYLKVKQETLLKQYSALQETLLALQDQQSMLDAMSVYYTY